MITSSPVCPIADVDLGVAERAGVDHGDGDARVAEPAHEGGGRSASGAACPARRRGTVGCRRPRSTCSIGEARSTSRGRHRTRRGRRGCRCERGRRRRSPRCRARPRSGARRAPVRGRRGTPVGGDAGRDLRAGGVPEQRDAIGIAAVVGDVVVHPRHRRRHVLRCASGSGRAPPRSGRSGGSSRSPRVYPASFQSRTLSLIWLRLSPSCQPPPCTHTTTGAGHPCEAGYTSSCSCRGSAPGTDAYATSRDRGHRRGTAGCADAAGSRPRWSPSNASASHRRRPPHAVASTRSITTAPASTGASPRRPCATCSAAS